MNCFPSLDISSTIGFNFRFRSDLPDVILLGWNVFSINRITLAAVLAAKTATFWLKLCFWLLYVCWAVGSSLWLPLEL
ncbi:hypothetical protein B0O80DRAFT_464942 [Mortierella sp. GBAus27b]|nr:hypothetical protein B0O80DRAFT_464942 [Mortierella sp. GBAus27b]